MHASPTFAPDSGTGQRLRQPDAYAQDCGERGYLFERGDLGSGKPSHPDIIGYRSWAQTPLGQCCVLVGHGRRVCVLDLVLVCHYYYRAHQPDLARLSGTSLHSRPVRARLPWKRKCIARAPCRGNLTLSVEPAAMQGAQALAVGGYWGPWVGGAQ